MAATVNGIPGDPPTEAPNPADPTSIAPDISDAAALKDAIQQGNIEAVRDLVENGPDLNSQLPGGGTALQIALQVAQPQTECVRMLLENGADIYNKEGGPHNALVIAVVKGDVSDCKGHTALENSFRNFRTYNVAKIVFPASVRRYEWTETWAYMRNKSDLHILRKGGEFSFMTTSEFLFSDPYHPSWNHFLLFPTEFKDIPDLDPNGPESLLLLNKNQLFVTDQPGFSCQLWYQVAARDGGGPDRWVLDQNSMLRLVNFFKWKSNTEFLACRFIATCASLCPDDEGIWPWSSDPQLGRTSLKLARRTHAALWIMVSLSTVNDRDVLDIDPFASAIRLTTSQHADWTDTLYEFLDAFVRTLKEEWTPTFETANNHLFEMRSVILKSRGSNHLIIDRLLQDALLWVQVETMVTEQRRDLADLNDLFEACRRGLVARDTTIQNSQDMAEIERFRIAVDDLDGYLAEGVKNLRQASQELIGLEFNLTSISEAQKSTSTSVSMKRLSWITFIFLPLTFVSSLFGMNVNVLESNPAWWIYLPFAFSTLGLTMVVWLTFKRYPSIEDKAERAFQKWMH